MTSFEFKNFAHFIKKKLSEIKILAMELDYNNLTLKTIKVHQIHVGSEWRTENFPQPCRIISWSRIYCPVSGEGLVTDCDQQYILKPGMMLLVPPFADVKVSCPEKMCKYWTHFNAFLPGTQTDIFFQHGKCIEIDIRDQQEYFSLLFDRLIEIEIQETQSTIDRYEYDSFLRLLIAPFLRALAEKPAKTALPRAIELLQYIAENYNRKITLNELAKVAGMHPNYLSTCFHRNMNMKIFEYIERVRLHHALEYFREGKMTISEIAEKTGYSSVQAFSKNFRKIYSVSPRNYSSMEKRERNELAAGFPKPLLNKG